MGRKNRKINIVKPQSVKVKKTKTMYRGVKTLAEAEEEKRIVELKKGESGVTENVSVVGTTYPEPDIEPIKIPQLVTVSDTEEEGTVETRDLAALVGFLIGVKSEYLEQYYNDCMDVFDRLKGSKEAKIIRYLCKIRTVLFQKFGYVDKRLRYDLVNIDRQEIFDAENIRELEKLGVPVVQANYTAEKYCTEISRLINVHIDACRSLFPDWVKWTYFREMFFIAKYNDSKVLTREKDRYRERFNAYPFHMYIHWNPRASSGLILRSDKKLLTSVYAQHGDRFNDYTKLRDAATTTKTNIYDFIDEAVRVAIAVDCENSDPFKLYSVIKGLDEEKLGKISKITLYDDANTTPAWDVLGKYLHIPVEHIEVERVVGHKSLVDIKMAVSVSKDYYDNGISSFLLFSSDSDYWALISSMPQTRFLVMYEYDKCGSAILAAMDEHDVAHCAIDDFCSVYAGDLKKLVLLQELKTRLPNILGLKPMDVAYDIYEATKITGTKQDIENFCEKYIKTLKLQVGEDGTLELAIRK